MGERWNEVIPNKQHTRASAIMISPTSVVSLGKFFFDSVMEMGQEEEQYFESHKTSQY